MAGAVEIGRVDTAKSGADAPAGLEDTILDLCVGAVAFERNTALTGMEFLARIRQLLVRQGGPVLGQSVDLQRLAVREGRARSCSGGRAHVLLEGGNHDGQRSVGLRLHKPIREEYAAT